MATIAEIRAMPTTFTPREPWGVAAAPAVHESYFRSYAILQKVKQWLGQGCPGPVLRELIEAMESGDE